MSGIGHNNGPSLEGGYSWRKHSWSKARADLLPNLPIEVLRGRVRRAKSLGLPYKTYASVRAASGRDVVAFLFSNNALQMLQEGKPCPTSRANVVRQADCSKLALVHRPLSPGGVEHLLSADGIDLAAVAARAPHFSESWAAISATVGNHVRGAGLPRDGVLVIGETGFERDWSEAAKLAGYLSAERYFDGAARN